MAETPYCPLLSIGKEHPVPCQEELCMLYVKQLKLCSITVMGYTNAINMQGGVGQATTQKAPSKPQKSESNPFAMDDLE